MLLACCLFDVIFMQIVLAQIRATSEGVCSEAVCHTQEHSKEGIKMGDSQYVTISVVTESVERKTVGGTSSGSSRTCR